MKYRKPCGECSGTGLDVMDGHCEWCGGTGLEREAGSQPLHRPKVRGKQKFWQTSDNRRNKIKKHRRPNDAAAMFFS